MCNRWIDPAPMAESEFRQIAKKYPAAKMADREVSTYVNNSSHEGPERLGPQTPHPAPKKKPDVQIGLGF